MATPGASDCVVAAVADHISRNAFADKHLVDAIPAAQSNLTETFAARRRSGGCALDKHRRHAQCDRCERREEVAVRNSTLRNIRERRRAVEHRSDVIPRGPHDGIISACRIDGRVPRVESRITHARRVDHPPRGRRCSIVRLCTLYRRLGAFVDGVLSHWRTLVVQQFSQRKVERVGYAIERPPARPNVRGASGCHSERVDDVVDVRVVGGRRGLEQFVTMPIRLSPNVGAR